MLSALLLSMIAANPVPALFSSLGPDSIRPRLQVKIDSSGHTVTLIAGPFDIPAGAPGHHHGTMQGGGYMQMGTEGADHMEMGMQATPMMNFSWPVDGWLHGASMQIHDAHGEMILTPLVHHMNVINFSRRQLLYDAPERILAMGQETEAIDLPKTVGVPVASGMRMGFMIMWHNTMPHAVRGVTARVTFEWAPTNQFPQPVSVLPLYMNVINPVGRSADFDLPAGTTTFHADFTLPIAGRIIAIGGHLHDYGEVVKLEELGGKDPKVLVRIKARLDSLGHIIEIDRKLPGISGPGIKLRAGQRYRISGSYDNITGHLIKDGAMVHLIALFAPADLSDWPAVDPDSPDFRRDVAFVEGNSLATH